MDQEISKGTWVGATILAIVAILGLSFAVYGISRSLVNNSSADFVKTIDTVGTSAFNDYDGTVVSGLQVRSALETYEGDKIAILINTAGIQMSQNNNSTGTITNPGTFQFGTYTGNAYGATTNPLKRKEVVDSNYDIGTFFQGKAYIEYNALFQPGTGTFTASPEGYLIFDGRFRLYSDIGGSTSDPIFNTIKANYKTNGCLEFIASGSNFNAKLIRDTTDTIVGIMFSQIY